MVQGCLGTKKTSEHVKLLTGLFNLQTTSIMASFYSILEIAHMGIAHIPSHYHLTSHRGATSTAGYCVQVASFKNIGQIVIFPSLPN